MTRQNIGVGASANDGTGDTLRTAGNKINENFVELYRFLGGGDSNNVSAQLTLEDSAIVFEGASSDAHETRLTAVDPTADTAVYNDIWVKRYVTALVKRQWGANLIKFQGTQLPGGITMNGEFIYNEGKEMVQKLEDEMLTVYETMPMDMIG